ncbi:MAG: hypothetical protein HYU46_18985 [Deltaproteobacteria bacterium]|nr:hypothetical protein [Deltaproteobacteria bacterium]
MNKTKEPKAGEKLSAEEAKTYVDYLYATLYKHAYEKIHNGPFMTQLREGRLPMPVIRQFFKNWGHFSLEVNGLNAVSYYTHLPFFVRRSVSTRGPRHQRFLPQDFHRRLHRRALGAACLRGVALTVVGRVVLRADYQVRLHQAGRDLFFHPRRSRYGHP